MTKQCEYREPGFDCAYDFAGEEGCESCIHGPNDIDEIAKAKPIDSFLFTIESLIMSGHSSRVNILLDILSERSRQGSVEGYTSAHDDEHDEGQLAVLAAAYALSSMTEDSEPLDYLIADIKDGYGWQFKPKTARQDLIRAGALILAELERLTREKIRESSM